MSGLDVQLSGWGHGTTKETRTSNECLLRQNPAVKKSKAQLGPPNFSNPEPSKQLLSQDPSTKLGLRWGPAEKFLGLLKMKHVSKTGMHPRISISNTQICLGILFLRSALLTHSAAEDERHSLPALENYGMWHLKLESLSLNSGTTNYEVPGI